MPVGSVCQTTSFLPHSMGQVWVAMPLVASASVIYIRVAPLLNWFFRLYRGVLSLSYPRCETNSIVSSIMQLACTFWSKIPGEGTAVRNQFSIFLMMSVCFIICSCYSGAANGGKSASSARGEKKHHMWRTKKTLARCCGGFFGHSPLVRPFNLWCVSYSLSATARASHASQRSNARMLR